MKSGIKNHKLIALVSCSRDLEFYRKLVVDHLAESLHVLGDIASSCLKNKLWNALADAVNDIKEDTTEELTSSAELVNCLLLRTKIDTPTTWGYPNAKFFF